MNSVKKNELKTQAAQLAAQLRDELHLTDLMPVSIHSLIREKNIQTLFRPMDNNASGMAIRTFSSNKVKHCFMMVNTDKALGHQRFTACHELYHLLYQEDFTCIKENTAVFDDTDPNEFAADWFASYLVLPHGALERLVPVSERHDAIQLATLLKIEQTLRCSRMSLLYRLKDLGWINRELMDKYATNVRKSALSYGYSIELYQPTGKEEFVGDYNILARRLFDEGRISQAMLYSLLEDIGVDFSMEAEDNGEV